MMNVLAIISAVAYFFSIFLSIRLVRARLSHGWLIAPYLFAFGVVLAKPNGFNDQSLAFFVLAICAAVAQWAGLTFKDD